MRIRYRQLLGVEKLVSVKRVYEELITARDDKLTAEPSRCRCCNHWFLGQDTQSMGPVSDLLFSISIYWPRLTLPVPVNTSRQSNPLVSTTNLPSKVYSASYAPATSTFLVSMSQRHVHVYDVRRMEKPSQERESALKFMTRSVACMVDGKGESGRLCLLASESSELTCCSTP